MDKQDELFKWIDENTGSGIVRGKLYFNSFYCDPYILKNKIKELAKEPQKVKVPEFVAEWFEKHKKYLDITLACLMPNIRTKVIQAKRPLTEFEKWANNASNKPFETIIRMLDGYEVEEEPKYEVDFGHDTILYQADGEFWIEARENNEGVFKQDFTEQEIKAIDERYWPFAVPVEEVVEG